MSTSMRDTESLSMSALSLVLIGPDEERRRAVVKALAGPQARSRASSRAIRSSTISRRSLKPDHDVVIIDLDPNPERALDVVENICAAQTARSP